MADARGRAGGRPVRVAVIGAGENSQRNHLPTLRRLAQAGRCELVGLCDLRREVARRTAASLGFQTSTHEAAELLALPDVDAIYVFGSVQMHYEYARAALDTGRHVFVEKPPAPAWPDAAELDALARAKGLVAVVGFNRRFQAAVVQAWAAFDGASRLQSAEAYFHKPAHDLRVPHGASSWLVENAIHAIDVLNFVAGDLPAELYSGSSAASGTAPTSFSALLKWANGCHALLASNNTAGARLERYVFHGASFSLVCSDEALERHTPTRTERVRFDATPEARGWWGEHVEFLDAVAGITPVPRHALRHGVAALYLAQLIERGFVGRLDWSEVRDPAGPSGGPRIEVSPATAQAVLVLSPPAVGPALPALRQRYRVVYEDQLPGLPADARTGVVALITGLGGSPAADPILDALPSLRVVGVVGGSVRRYNAASVLRRGIPIINTSDVYAVAVAELVVMLAILGVRGASRGHELIRSGHWGLARQRPVERLVTRLLTLGRPVGRLPSLAPLKRRIKGALRRGQGAGGRRGAPGSTNFTGTTFGIVGFGAIARRVVELLRPFECRVRVCSEHLSDAEAATLGVEKTDLAGALTCRVVSLHRGRSPRTIGAIGARELELLTPGAVFINTARGELVDTEALRRRLRRGDVFACLDVFDTEPLSARDPLRRLPNVFLTPHIAASTGEMYEDAGLALVEKITAFLDGTYTGPLIADETRLGTMT